jgi:N-acetylmuramoyl-L-alanine amidase
MLLNVRDDAVGPSRNTHANRSRLLRAGLLVVAILGGAVGIAASLKGAVFAGASLAPDALQQQASSPLQAGQYPTTQGAAPAQSGPQTPSAPPVPAVPVPLPPPPPRPGLNVVVLDPAHGGTDSGARGSGGISESAVVLEFATQVRQALEGQGFQVIMTRQGNENPSFNDRSTVANSQHGAVLVTLHVSSTGLAGTARVYVSSDLPGSAESNGLIPWDRAQAPYLGLSRKLGDGVAGFLAQRFKGSPSDVQGAAVRLLRTTAAPAIAVEISSVSVEDRNALDRMAPGIADAITRGVVAFKPSYVVPSTGGGQQ